MKGSKMSNIKDLLTTIFAIVAIVAGAINGYLQSIGTGEIDWFQFTMAIIVALVAWLTGKNANGTSKSANQLTIQKKAKESTK